MAGFAFTRCGLCGAEMTVYVADIQAPLKPQAHARCVDKQKGRPTTTTRRAHAERRSLEE